MSGVHRSWRPAPPGDTCAPTASVVDNRIERRTVRRVLRLRRARTGG